MRVRAVLAAVAIAAVVVLKATGPADAAGYLVGAARVDITPQVWNAADYTRVFPESACPRAAYPDHGRFLLEEPYHDANGNGRFDYAAVPDPTHPGPPDPGDGNAYCDANHNGRYDGIFDSGGVNRLVTGVDDPIDARAIALSDGARTYVVVSVVAQGLHENYIEDMRNRARTARPGITDVVVSANHHESSPDTVASTAARSRPPCPPACTPASTTTTWSPWTRESPTPPSPPTTAAGRRRCTRASSRCPATCACACRPTSPPPTTTAVPRRSTRRPAYSRLATPRATRS